MVGPSYIKTLLPFQSISTKSPSSSPSSSSTLSSMKIKTLTHTLIYAQLSRLVRAFSKAKSLLIRVYKETKPIKYFISNSKSSTRKKHKHKHKHAKLFFGSFRLHYNWGSSRSHVTPVTAPVLEGCTAEAATHLYYDSTWNSVISTEQCDGDTAESELSGYLQWLEEKKGSGNSSGENDMNEIDKLAEMFIADCYEKFALEKQESNRRFQEMMARSM